MGTDATPALFARHSGSQGQTRVVFSALRETAVLFVNGVVIPAWGKRAFLLSALRPSGRQKWARASARNCGRRIAGRDACPALPCLKELLTASALLVSLPLVLCAFHKNLQNLPIQVTHQWGSWLPYGR